MNALLVGADRLGNIPDILSRFNIQVVSHISGRDSSHQRKSMPLPAGTEVVILFTDFIGHNVMLRFREAAQREKIKLICCRRSVCALQQALDKHMPENACQGCTLRCRSKISGQKL